MGFVLYLGGMAIMNGFAAKEANKTNKEDEPENKSSSDKNNTLSEELNELNELHKTGVITQEEFEKAKKKILEN